MNFGNEKFWTSSLERLLYFVIRKFVSKLSYQTKKIDPFLLKFIFQKSLHYSYGMISGSVN